MSWIQNRSESPSVSRRKLAIGLRGSGEPSGRGGSRGIRKDAHASMPMMDISSIRKKKNPSSSSLLSGISIRVTGLAKSADGEEEEEVLELTENGQDGEKEKEGEKEIEKEGDKGENTEDQGAITVQRIPKPSSGGPPMQLISPRSVRRKPPAPPKKSFTTSFTSPPLALVSSSPGGAVKSHLSHLKPSTSSGSLSQQSQPQFPRSKSPRADLKSSTPFSPASFSASHSSPNSPTVLRNKSLTLCQAGPSSDKRATIYKELLATEETYLEGLNILLVEFLQPLLSFKFHDKTLVSHTIPQLISKVEMLRTMNNMLFASIKEGKEKVAQTFIDMSGQLKAYSVYVNEYNLVNSAITEASEKTPKLKAFLDKTRDNTGGGLPLGAYLVLPIQRIPRYQLILHSLLQATPFEEKEAVAALQKAHGLIKNLAEYINEKKRHTENMNKVIEIQQKFRPKDVETLPQPHRTFAKEGTLLVVKELCAQSVDTSVMFPVSVYLFNDLLLCGLDNDDHLLLNKRIKLDKMCKINSLVDVSPTACLFEIVNATEEKQAITFCASSSKEKNQWVKALSECILALSDKSPEQEVEEPNIGGVVSDEQNQETSGLQPKDLALFKSGTATRTFYGNEVVEHPEGAGVALIHSGAAVAQAKFGEDVIDLWQQEQGIVGVSTLAPQESSLPIQYVATKPVTVTFIKTNLLVSMCLFDASFMKRFYFHVAQEAIVNYRRLCQGAQATNPVVEYEGVKMPFGLADTRTYTNFKSQNDDESAFIASKCKLPDDWLFITSFDCSLKRKGQLFVLRQALVFYSKAFGREEKKIFETNTIVDVTSSGCDLSIESCAGKISKFTFAQESTREKAEIIISGITNQKPKIDQLEKIADNFSEQDWEVLLKNATKVKVPKGRLVVKEGEMVPTFIRVERGVCRLHTTTDGTETVVGYLFFGSLANEGCVFGMPEVVSITTDTECELACFSLDALDFLFKLNPNLGARFYKYILEATFSRIGSWAEEVKEKAKN